MIDSVPLIVVEVIRRKFILFVSHQTSPFKRSDATTYILIYRDAPYYEELALS